MNPPVSKLLKDSVHKTSTNTSQHGDNEKRKTYRIKFKCVNLIILAFSYMQVLQQVKTCMNMVSHKKSTQAKVKKLTANALLAASAPFMQ